MFTLIVVSLLVVSVWQFRLWAVDGWELLVVTALALMAAVSILGLMGLCTLFCGEALGRYSTYPFTIYFAAFFGLSSHLRSPRVY